MIDLSELVLGDGHIDLLRHLLSEDDDEPGQYDEPTAPNDIVIHNLMGYSAFVVAVLRKFSPTFSVSEIIQYVSDLRKSLIGDESLQVNPRVAEGLIRDVLQDKTFKDTPPFGADNETMAKTSFVILLDLVQNLQLDGPGLEEFLRESVDYARRWLVAQQAPDVEERAATP
ncbi:hypothetical protein GCM10022254_33530 [Actinomadura meridiana]|uniref:Uncharacterized protein n=1 Tax=Actinomadura meridiana TaxID=559626 RepID=A0ABP8C3T7_9ACTN